jgi:acyl-coenzyme A synthetase/AMP-(fatty) acid ligase
MIDEGTSRIVGVVATSNEVRGTEVKARLAGVLPAYMVPDRIVVLRSLPKNANGKVDRGAIRDACVRGELR